jgi:uncharacterized surface protein with fasciclin (FAS1) repeats
MSTLKTAAFIAALAVTTAGCANDGMGASEAGMKAGMSASGQNKTSMPAMPMAKESVMVGGAAMYPTKTIVENAANSADHTTLVAAVKAAGLVETLSGPGPFTVFAPTNAAFAKLPAGTVDKLVMPENKTTLQGVLTYHVVAGRMTAADILAAIKAGGGKAQLTTVAGGKLTASLSGSGIVLTDAKGGISHVTIGDVIQSNGVIHVVDTVMMP